MLCLKETDNYAVIQIQDNGKGISEEDLPFVFDRYSRGKNSEKDRSTGLGLAISKEIISTSGGFISVESKEAKGTCFTIHLPKYN